MYDMENPARTGVANFPKINKCTIGSNQEPPPNIRANPLPTRRAHHLQLEAKCVTLPPSSTEGRDPRGHIR